MSLNTKGLVFTMSCAEEVTAYAGLNELLPSSKGPIRPWISYDHCASDFREMFQYGCQFYQQSHVLKPGLLHMAIGLIDVLGVSMQ